MNDKDKKGLTDKIPDQVTEISDKIKESANQIWLAGLGAFNKIEEEGNKIFDTLVSEGQNLEKKTREILDKPVSIAKKKAVDIKSIANDSIDKIENSFEDKVYFVLTKLNIPTSADVERLEAQIEALEAKIDELSNSAE